MKMSVLNTLKKPTSPLLNTQLQQIGVRIRPKPSEPNRLPNADIAEAPLSDLLINTVHLRSFAFAHDATDKTKSYTDIPLQQDVHLDSLLQALHQVGENFNQENALRLHADTQRWVNEITQQMNLPEDTPYGLSLKGSFGEIELDLEQLQPRRIRAVFNELLAGLNAEDLRQNHELLGDHTHILAGLSAPASEGEQKTQELIALANALEQELTLSPTPDSPDILILLRAFLDILRQLDIDMSALQEGLAAQALQAKKIGDDFALQLRSRLLGIQQLSVNTRHPEWDAIKALKL